MHGPINTNDLAIQMAKAVVNALVQDFIKKKKWSKRYTQSDGPFMAHLPIDRLSIMTGVNYLDKSLKKRLEQ